MSFLSRLLVASALIGMSQSVLAVTLLPSGPYVIATSGVYNITVAGGAGGPGNFGAQGGAGALLSGNFSFTSGQVLNFTIGSIGNYAPSNAAGGGGGGTFVTVTNGGVTTLLLDAGGGGGAANSSSGGSATLIGGSGGNGVTSFSSGGGGYNNGSGTELGGASTFGAGGGGGGYTGGDGATQPGVRPGSGGTSYYDASVLNLTQSFNANSGGYAYINFVSPPPPAVTPEPSSLLLLATGMMAGAGALRRRL